MLQSNEKQNILMYVINFVVFWPILVAFVFKVGKAQTTAFGCNFKLALISSPGIPSLIELPYMYCTVSNQANQNRNTLVEEELTSRGSIWDGTWWSIYWRRSSKGRRTGTQVNHFWYMHVHVKWTRKFFCQSANRKSANSWARFVIAINKFLRCAVGKLQIRKFVMINLQIVNPKIATFAEGQQI